MANGGKGVAVLEAALVAWLVAVLGDRTLSGLKVLIRGKPEQAALATAMSVASAALLGRVPVAARAAFADALSNSLTEPPAIVFDGEVPVTTAIIAGLLAQVRPLTDASITTSGRSYLSEIGVDDSVLTADLPDIVVRSIQQVGATNKALQPLAAQLNADIIQADTGQIRADARLILDAVQALLLQSGPAPAGTASVPRAQQLTVELLDPIIGAAKQVPSFADYNSRNAIINMLRADIQGSLSRSPISAVEIVNTVKTCANYSGGLNELMAAIRLIEGDSGPMQALEQAIGALGGNDLVRRQLESGPSS